MCYINNNNEMSYHAVIFSMTSASISSSSSLSILPPTISQLRLLICIVMWEMQLSLHSEDKQSKNALHHSWGNVSFHSSLVNWSWTGQDTLYPAVFPSSSWGIQWVLKTDKLCNLSSEVGVQKAIGCWTTSNGYLQYEGAAALIRALACCLSFLF